MSSNHYYDSGPASFPHRRYGTPTFMARVQKFPSQSSRVVIEDCDASSDEEDDADEVGKHSSRSHRKSIRRKTLEEFATLWKKTLGLPPALLPATSSGSSSPALHSAETTEYEKKQAQIKLMTERIRQLEAARKRAREAAVVESSEQQEVEQAGAPAHPVPVTASAPETNITDEVVMAALPVEYGGSTSAAARSSVELHQTIGVPPSALKSPTPSPVLVSSKPLSQVEAGSSQPTSPSPAPPVQRIASEDLEEGEYAQATETAAETSSTLSTKRLALNPQLAEQKRRLLEAMKKKVKSDPVTPEEPLPLSVTLKRKADDGEELSTAPNVELSTIATPPATVPNPTFAASQPASTEEISSKRLKRQRKKARQRAAAAALLEAPSAKKDSDEVAEARQEEGTCNCWKRRVSPRLCKNLFLQNVIRYGIADRTRPLFLPACWLSCHVVDKSEVSRPWLGRSQEDRPIHRHTVHDRSLLGVGLLT